MKRTKRIFAIFMTLALAMSMLIVSSAVSFAAGDDTTPTTYTVKVGKDVTDKANHTYAAYQIFKGKLETKDGKKVLSDIQWGDNVNSATLIEELKKLNDFSSLADNASANDVAKAISDKNYTFDSAGAQALADAINKAITGDEKGSARTPVAEGDDEGKYVIGGLSAGYYLVKDKEAVTGEGAQTRFILQVVDNVDVTEKANIPSVTKKVKERNDGNGNVTDWQDAADYDIGDSIPYKLEGTLPGKFEEFDTYKVYKFTDTLSTGLTPPKADEVKVKLDTENGTDISELFDVAVNGQTLTVTLKEGVDLRTAQPGFTHDSKIIVTYNAVLNENANIGSAGNPNTVYLEFTNNPNGEQDGEKGTTPEDKVIVFTYEIKALKVEPTNDAAIDKTAYDALTDAEKADYVKVGDKYQKTQALSGAGFTLYKKVNGSYEPVGEEVTGVTTFTFKGTDAGEYKLVETTVPAGYSKAADVEIKVTAGYDKESADPKLTSLTVSPEAAGFVVESTTTTTGEGDDAVQTATYSGDITGKILNQKGAVLPSTGGIGTIIFYVLGSLLVVGCGIVLISKRRMESR